MLMAQSTATSHGEMRLLEHVEVIRLSSAHVQSAPSRSTKEPRNANCFGAVYQQPYQLPLGLPGRYEHSRVF